MQLIHASKIWQSPITENLWTYALHMENDSTNNTPSYQDPQICTPHQIFTRTEVKKTQKTGYHLYDQHFIWKLDMKQSLYVKNINNDRGLVYTWEKPPITNVMSR